MAKKEKKGVTLEEIKELRAKTAVGIGDCKEALEESDGDMEKAVEYLRKKGIAKSAKRADRAAENGFVGSYVHQGKIGVLVELLCETDFVARNEDFQALANDIAVHIAAYDPLYVRPEDISGEFLEKEKDIYREEVSDGKKPPEVVEKIVEGKLKKYYEEVCLLEQPFVKDEKKKVKDLLAEAVAKIGEKIEIGRFERLEIGVEED